MATDSFINLYFVSVSSFITNPLEIFLDAAIEAFVLIVFLAYDVMAIHYLSLVIATVAKCFGLIYLVYFMQFHVSFDYNLVAIKA